MFRQPLNLLVALLFCSALGCGEDTVTLVFPEDPLADAGGDTEASRDVDPALEDVAESDVCLLYTSPSPRDS